MKQMTKHLSILALAALIAAFGCTSPKDNPGEGTTGESTAGGTAVATPPDPTPADLPADVKTEAFAYLGLDTEGTSDYEYGQLEGVDPQPGTQSIELVSEDGENIYVISRGGSLANLGNERLEAREDGVYQVEMSLGELPEPTLMMPADVAPGKTWTTSFELDNTTSSQPINFNVNHKAERVEKVTVPSGEYDALLVTATGTMKVGEDEYKLNSKTWYAKGIGTVKMTLDADQGNGQSSNATIALTKEQSDGNSEDADSSGEEESTEEE